MISLVFFFALSFTTPNVNPTVSLPQIRSMYMKANESEKICKDLITLLKPYDESNNPLFMGYKAGANMIMAKHSMNPISKMSWFNKGKKMLETAIQANNKDVELRCLRFGIQSNVPSFLSYKQDIQKDKKFILQSYPHVQDATLKTNIVSYLTKWGDLTQAEKALLK
ncbi:MAG: hypothetical protein ABIW47_05615 [Ginsengibacter sp.]